MNTVSTTTKTPASCGIGCGISCTAMPFPVDVMIGFAVGHG